MASLLSLVSYSDNEDEQEDKNRDSLVEYKDEDAAVKEDGNIAGSNQTTGTSSLIIYYDVTADFYISQSDEESLKDNAIDTDLDEIDKIQLPPEPDGVHSLSVQKKIITMMARKFDGNMNKILQRRKDFRNPSIYEKLVEFCAIDETGTNYPVETYNPKIWDKQDYYSVLAKTQKEAFEKKEKAKQSRTQIDFVKAVKKNTSSNANSAADDGNRKRKSKWDIPSNTMNNQADSAAANRIDSGSNVKKPRNTLS